MKKDTKKLFFNKFIKIKTKIKKKQTNKQKK